MMAGLKSVTRDAIQFSADFFLAKAIAYKTKITKVMSVQQKKINCSVTSVLY